MQEQVKIFDFSLADLDVRKERIRAAVEFGTALESELAKIDVRILELTAQKDHLLSNMVGMQNSLAGLLGIVIATSTVLELPHLPDPHSIPKIDRPEQQLFRLQREAILANSDLVDASLKPRLSTFAEVGLGYPNPLNILDSNMAPYGLIGARFMMPITDWKKNQIDKQLLSLQAQRLSIVEATFEFNMDAKVENYLATLNGLEIQLKHDRAIVDLQSKILAQLADQLDEGMITSADYLTQVNAELRAKQNLLIHQTEIIKTQLEFFNDRGGW